MSPRAPRVRRLAANAALTGRTVADHLLDDPVVLALQVSRRLPTGLRARVGGVLADVPARVAVPRGIGLAMLGREEQLQAALVDADDAPGPRERARRAEVLLAAGRDEDAERLLADVPADAPGAAEARARLRWHRGDMTGAVLVLSPHGRQGRLRARLAAERDSLLGRPVCLSAEDRALAADYEPRPGHVLFVLTNSLPHTGSGYVQRSHSLLTAVRDAGWSVAAVTRLGWPVQTGVLAAEDVDRVDGVAYHRLLPAALAPGFGARLDQHAAALLRLVLRERPAVLHTTTHWVNAAVTAAVAEAVGIPWVYEVRGQLADTWASTRGPQALMSERYRAFRTREAEAAARADGVVTLAETMRARLAEDGVDPEDVVLSPNAVGGAFLDAPGERAAARRALGLAPDAEYIGTVSSVVPYEGLDDLVRVVALLADRRPRLRLLVAGDGTALPGLAALAEQLGVRDRVDLLGRVERARAPLCHQALDVFCVPRRDTSVTRDVTPMKPLEAMASARPVLLSRLPALQELVAEGETGATVPASDPEAWAEAVEALLADPNAAAAMGDRARAWVLAERTWAANARRYTELYARLGAVVDVADRGAVRGG
ncbi:glycosyltransferase [Micrococcus porci]|uniref:glycosyltransferase family 4 protein n=1 Tax=Micrococcus porci TaxID=2856555 RepID=UPI001CC9D2E6|nr:glycosyltransferase [Micrococcus porci]UBH24160.1 glycosyltransferase [Micrococcus porci]